MDSTRCAARLVRHHLTILTDLPFIHRLQGEIRRARSHVVRFSLLEIPTPVGLNLFVEVPIFSMIAETRKIRNFLMVKATFEYTGSPVSSFAIRLQLAHKSSPCQFQ